jgi:hypothetical protein
MPALLGRGQYLYVGGGMGNEQERFDLLRLSDFRRMWLRAPVASYVQENPEMGLPGKRGQAPLDQFLVRGLLFYDPVNREAGVEIADHDASRVKRHFYMHWDVAANRITEVTLVVRSTPQISWASLWPVGYEHKSRSFYYLRDIELNGRRDQPRKVTIIAFSRGKAKVVCQFSARRSIFRRVAFDPKRLRALAVEYGERGTDSALPTGYLIDLRNGRVSTFLVPFTAYGATFDPDGRHVHVYSSQLGEVWTIDLASGKVVTKLAAGTLGHALGHVNSASLLLVRNSGLQQLHYAKRGLRKGRYVPIKEIYSGFSAVNGSLVIPSGAIIKNGQMLYHVGID